MPKQKTPLLEVDLVTQITERIQHNSLLASLGPGGKPSFRELRPQVSLTITLRTILDILKPQNSKGKCNSPELISIDTEIDRSASYSKLQIMEFLGDRLAMIAGFAEAIDGIRRQAKHSDWPAWAGGLAPNQWNALVGILTSNDFFDLCAEHTRAPERLSVDGHKFADQAYPCDMLEAYLGRPLLQKDYAKAYKTARAFFKDLLKHPFFQELVEFAKASPNYALHADSLTRDKHKYYTLRLSAEKIPGHDHPSLSFNANVKGRTPLDCFAKALFKINGRIKAFADPQTLMQGLPTRRRLQSDALRGASSKINTLQLLGVKLASTAERVALLSLFSERAQEFNNYYYRLGSKVFELYVTRALMVSLEAQGRSYTNYDLRQHLDNEFLPAAGQHLKVHAGRNSAFAKTLNSCAKLVDPALQPNSIKWKGLVFTMIGIKFVQDHPTSLEDTLQFCKLLCEPGLFVRDHRGEQALHRLPSELSIKQNPHTNHHSNADAVRNRKSQFGNKDKNR